MLLRDHTLSFLIKQTKPIDLLSPYQTGFAETHKGTHKAEKILAYSGFFWGGGGGGPLNSGP